MKNFIIFLIASLSFASCNIGGDSLSGNGNMRDEKRNVSNFHAIKTSGSIDVTINTGDYSVVVQDDENLLPYIITEVKDGVLEIYFKNAFSISNSDATVFVTAPSLDKISGSGSSDIKSNGTLKNTDGIEFVLSGSGGLEANVDAPSIKVTVTGSGDIELTGKTKNFECKVSGSGDVQCGNLQSENCAISVSGSANALVFASVHLVARASGSGDIIYRGNLASPEIHTSGSGTVQAQK